jgi:hypothetical protein
MKRVPFQAPFFIFKKTDSMLSRTLLVTQLLFVCLSAFAQGPHHNMFMNDAQGRPFQVRSNFVAEGSPYLYDEYQLADLTTTDGRVYKDVKVKFNLHDNELQYLNDKGEEMTTTLSISKVSFHPVKDKNGSNTVLRGAGTSLNRTGDTVFQVIDSGRLSLVKHVKVKFTDEKRYNEANTTRVFSKTETYYTIGREGKRKFEKNKSHLLELMADKKTQVNEFIEKNDLKCKKEDELAMVFRYYNSLQ